MKNVSIGLVALFLAGCGGGGGSDGTALPQKTCSDFAIQEQAQAFFSANGGSPSNNFDNLDPDHNGIACENLPHQQG